MNAPFKLTAQKPTASPAWFDPKLEEIAANIEIKRDNLSAQYQRREMPFDVEERWGKLDEAWELICSADNCLRDAVFNP